MNSNSETMVLEYDEYHEWNAVDVNGPHAQIVQTDKGVFAVSDIQYYSNDQWQKLIWMFNLYQHFRFEKVSLTWIPRYNNQTAPVAYSVMRQSTQDTGNIDRQANTLTSMGDNGYVTFVEDWDDTIIRANLDEYWQAINNSKAVTGSWHEKFTKTFHPHTLDVVQTYTDSVGSVPGGNMATSAYAVSANNLAQNAGDVPMACPWFATKVVDENNTAGQTYLNTKQKFNGYKIYVYTPFNDPVVQSALQRDEVIGLKRFRYVISFKDRDTRALLSSTNLAGEHELHIKAMNNIIRKRGLKGLLYDNKAPSMKTPAAIQEVKDQEMASTESLAPPLKKQKNPIEQYKDDLTAGAASPARASQGTLQSHPRPGPVGLPKRA